MTTLTTYEIGASDDVAEGGRLIVDIGDVTIGVFRFKGRLFAYHNLCPHQGGPACQGRMVHRVCEDLDSRQMTRGLTFDEGDLHIVCPWHGFEFNVTTGVHPGQPKFRLKPVTVSETDGRVHVSL
ncbi:Rieske (2Fe-2S) protein [Streptomyces antimycoticus]|uniref:Rieske (2Fe-2S) protein n=2 Tax=Streptomyces TaxID=1883 RepID=UPI000A3B07B9|nr:Rieske (2Fe-2S) protein [Streptomyces antimycoticus]